MNLSTRLAVLLISIFISSGINAELTAPHFEYYLSHKKIIVVDAGSSGTRVMSYSLVQEPHSPLFDLKAQSDLIEAERLEDGVLLATDIIDFIRHHHRHRVSLFRNLHFFMGATAGLRAKQGEIAQKILIDKTEELNRQHTPARYNRNARLLTGLDEGSYTWFGINFILRFSDEESSLFDRLHNMATGHENQYGIVEMGGGSVQVAFSLPHKASYDGLRKETGEESSQAIANVKSLFLGSLYRLNIYSSSLAERGLMYAVQKINTAYLHKPESNPCLNKGMPVIIPGSDDITPANGDYQRCYDSINSTLFLSPKAAFNGDEIINRAYQKNLPDRFFLTGYFYDKTKAMGFPSKFTIDKLEHAAEYICNLTYEQLEVAYSKNQLFDDLSQTASPESEAAEDFFRSGQPRPGDIEQYCTHLTYMAMYLRKIGLSEKHQLITRKSLTYKGSEYGSSWPLGYAILSGNNWINDDD